MTDSNLLHIPITQGMSEAGDAKLLPNGLFTRVENARFLKDGRLGKRAGAGAHPNGALADSVIIGADSRLMTFGSEQLVWAGSRLYAAFRNSAGWVRRTRDLHVAPDAPQRTPVFREDAIAGAVSCAYTDNATSTGYSIGYVFVRQTGAGTKELVLVIRSVETGAEERREVVDTGANIEQPLIAPTINYNSLVIVWKDGTNLRIRKWQSNNWVNAATTIRAITNPSGIAISQTPWADDEVVVASFAAPNLRMSRVTASTGAEVATLDFNIGGGLPRPAIDANPSEGVWMTFVMESSRDVRVMAANTSFAQTLASTLIETMGVLDNSYAFPTLVRVNSTTRRVFWTRESVSLSSPPYESVKSQLVTTTALSGGTSQIAGVSLASHPFVETVSGRTFVVLSNARAPLDRAYFLCDVSEDVVANPNPSIRAEFCRGIAIIHGATGGGNNLPFLCTAEAGVWTYPAAVIARGTPDVSTTFALDSVKLDFNNRHNWRPEQAHGHLLFSGPLARFYDGVSICEAGLLESPSILTYTTGAGANIGPGVFSYVAVHELVTGAGTVLQSAPSAPFTITLGAAVGTVTLTIRRYNLSQKFPAANYSTSAFAVRTRIYRTDANGSTYYLASGDTAVEYTALGSVTQPTFADSMTDAVLTTKARLYTQVGNLLPNAPPPACRMLVVGDGRIMAEGLENPRVVRWSKLFVDQEGPHWVDDDTFMRVVDEPTTGGAYMDGTWYAFTASGIYQTSGAGPDDSGIGSYPPFVRIPSDAGCYDRRSIVETSVGIFFLAQPGQLWAIPRGGGAPEWVGQPVRDILTAYPVIKSAQVLARDQLVEFVCCTDETSTATSAVVQFDLRARLWFVDFMQSGAGLGVMSSGRLGSANAYAVSGETRPRVTGVAGYEYQDAGSVGITQKIITGDVRPTGPLAHCRFVMLQLLGEYRADAQLTIEISYDSGLTWPNSKVFTVSGLSVGEMFKREYAFPRQKAEAVRFRISVAGYAGLQNTEGLILNVLTVEVAPQSRLPRLGSGKRG